MRNFCLIWGKARRRDQCWNPIKLSGAPERDDVKPRLLFHLAASLGSVRSPAGLLARSTVSVRDDRARKGLKWDRIHESCSSSFKFPFLADWFRHWFGMKPENISDKPLKTGPKVLKEIASSFFQVNEPMINFSNKAPTWPCDLNHSSHNHTLATFRYLWNLRKRNVMNWLKTFGSKTATSDANHEQSLMLFT